jgi:acyl-CoA synthetase (AMP-forming)/AMP-acid ligase II
MFTSGTTAQPRVVRITHANLIANTESIVEYLDLHCDDRIMAVLPLHYCFGASLLHTHLRVGGSIVLGNSFAYPETILERMEVTHCTGLAGVPSTYQILLRNSSFPRRPLPDLVKIQQAGGKLHNALLEELIRSHPQSRVFVMYGQTEATARLSYLPPELLSRKLGSIGKGIPGVKLEVLKEGDVPVKPGEIGEIVASGNNISPGYLDNPEANEYKFFDGRLRTGDLATVDADGYIYIVDRKDDFIKSFGYRISSYEVESCVLQIPDVVSAAAVGVEDPTAGEAVVVFAVLRSGSACTANDILAHCRSKLANHMLPKKIVFLPALPVNANGKIVKAELKRRDREFANEENSFYTFP